MQHPIVHYFLIWLATMFGIVVTNADSTDDSCEKNGGLTFEDWSEWTLITPKPLKSEGHGAKWVKIHVNDLAESTYLGTSAPYPECAKVVKSHYIDANGSQIDGLTVMVKMPSGYDPQNGDWWYGIFDKSGTVAKKQGRLYHDCIVCHRQAAKTDYLFSKEVLHEVQE